MLVVSILAAVLAAAPARSPGEGTAAGDSSRSLEIRDVRWGFTGEMARQRLCPVSLLVQNNGDTAFEGTLTFERRFATRTGTTRVGLPSASTLYLAPQSSRWVQFYVSAETDTEEYVVSWSAAQDRARAPGAEARSARSTLHEHELPTPRLGPPGHVLLYDGDNPFSERSKLKSFPWQLFPVGVGGTDGLKSVALDQEPRWDAVRRRAFRDWLSAGGVVHLFHDPATGEFPRFRGVLAVLNAAPPGEPAGPRGIGSASETSEAAPAAGDAAAAQSAERVKPYGAGRIVFHATTWKRLSESEIARRITERDLAPDADSETEQSQRSLQMALESGYVRVIDAGFMSDAQSSMLMALKDLTVTSHGWPLLYLLSIGYLVAVAGGGGLLGWRRVDHRVIHGLLLATVLALTAAMTWIGKRGHGEGSTLHGVAVMRPIDEGRYDVSAFVQTFQTEGGRVELTAPGEHSFWTAALERDAAQGAVEMEGRGRITLEMPPYSSRTLAVRYDAPGPRLGLRVHAFAGGANLTALDVELGAGDAQTAAISGGPVEDLDDEGRSAEPARRERTPPADWNLPIKRAVAVYGLNAYDLEVDGRRLTLESDARQRWHQRLQLDQLRAYGFLRESQPSVVPRKQDDRPPFDRAWEEFRAALAIHAFQFDVLPQAAALAVPGDRVRLLLETDFPLESQIALNRRSTRQGRCLFVVDVLRPAPQGEPGAPAER